MTSAVLAVVGRGELPFALLHDRPLHLHALDALLAAGEDVTVVVDLDRVEQVAGEVARAGLSARVMSIDQWSAEPWSAGAVLVHDPLCPLTSSAFLTSVRHHVAARPDLAVVAYRPVTDTIKTVEADRIRGTLDREGLADLTAPALIPAGLLAEALEAGEPPPLHDLAQLADWLGARGDVSMLEAPSLGRRVDDLSAVVLLECVEELSRG